LRFYHFTTLFIFVKESFNKNGDKNFETLRETLNSKCNSMFLLYVIWNTISQMAVVKSSQNIHNSTSSSGDPGKLRLRPLFFITHRLNASSTEDSIALESIGGSGGNKDFFARRTFSSRG
jgi:hypothetical protein